MPVRGGSGAGARVCPPPHHRCLSGDSLNLFGAPHVSQHFPWRAAGPCAAPRPVPVPVPQCLRLQHSCCPAALPVCRRWAAVLCHRLRPSAEPTPLGKLRAAFGPAPSSWSWRSGPVRGSWRRGGRDGSGGSAPRCCLCPVRRFCLGDGGELFVFLINAQRTGCGARAGGAAVGLPWDALIPGQGVLQGLGHAAGAAQRVLAGSACWPQPLAAPQQRGQLRLPGTPWHWLPRLQAPRRGWCQRGRGSPVLRGIFSLVVRATGSEEKANSHLGLPVGLGPRQRHPTALSPAA